jgi:hypothetical protein
LEERVTKLERQVAVLMANGVQPKKDWQSTIGIFSGDEIMKEIDAYALAYREADRRRARRRWTKRRKAKA